MVCRLGGDDTAFRSQDPDLTQTHLRLLRKILKTRTLLVPAFSNTYVVGLTDIRAEDRSSQKWKHTDQNLLVRSCGMVPSLVLRTIKMTCLSDVGRLVVSRASA